MAKFNPGVFVREVRQEFAKVTWPTPKERNVTMVLVLIMVTILALFFLGVDQVLSAFIKWVLGIGS
jgi:preprotein translocase subunit SecE